LTIRSLYLELTSKCNLRCPYCFNFSNEGPRQQQATEQLFTVIQQAHELLKIEELVLSGGEVMLHPDWKQVVEYGRSFDLTVSIITNGLAITESVVSFLLEQQVQVCLSLGGTCEEEDAPLRGHYAWFRSVRGLELLSQRGLKPGLAYIIHRNNLGSAQRAVNLASAHQVAWLRFSLIRKLGRAEFYWDSIGLSLTEKLSFLQEYGQLKCPEELDIILAPDPELDRLTPLFVVSPTGTSNNLTEVCLRFDGSVDLEDHNWRYWDAFLQEQVGSAYS
jgi:MoaA/NifB/PqqE/SkfB family radical SAM enzyme